MGRSQLAGGRARGGELIPSLGRAGRARLALASAAVALDLALGISVATDAGTASGPAWYGVVGTGAMLAVSLGVGSSAGVRASVASLGLMLLLRRDDRLVVAPLYGGALLVIIELARTCHELRRMDLVGRGVIRGRLLTILLFAGLGTCGASLAALAVTAAPARSVGITALGTVAVAVAFAGVLAIARRNEHEAGTVTLGGQTAADRPNPTRRRWVGRSLRRQQPHRRVD